MLDERRNLLENAIKLIIALQILHLHIGQAGTQLGNSAWELYVLFPTDTQAPQTKALVKETPYSHTGTVTTFN